MSEVIDLTTEETPEKTTKKMPRGRLSDDDDGTAGRRRARPAKKKAKTEVITVDDDDDNNSPWTTTATAPSTSTKEAEEKGPNEEQPHPRPKVFECPICFEETRRRDGHSLTACGCRFCAACLRGLVETKLSEKAAHTLRCPTLTCGVKLEPRDVRACTLDRGFVAPWTEYQNQATAKLLDDEARDDSSTVRRCPAERCNFTFQYEPSDRDGSSASGALFICPECDAAFCLNCPAVGGRVGPAHDGSCASVVEALRKDAERKRKLEEWQRDNAKADERFEQLLQKEKRAGLTKPCPKCKTPITKNAGCDHMHCTVCGHHYAWSTGHSMMGNFGGHAMVYGLMMGVPGLAHGRAPAAFANGATPHGGAAPFVPQGHDDGSEEDYDSEDEDDYDEW